MNWTTMAKIKITGLNEVMASLKDLFENKIADTKILTDAATFTLERIRSFTRSGKSLVTGSKLKPLSESYKDVRRGANKWRTLPDGRKILINEPDEKLKEVDVNFFDPEYSNLTYTGQLMESLDVKINYQEKSYVIAPNDKKRRGKYEKLTNKQVAEYVADNGRPFLGIDAKGVDRIKKLIVNNIRKQLIRKGLKK